MATRLVIRKKQLRLAECMRSSDSQPELPESHRLISTSFFSAQKIIECYNKKQIQHYFDKKEGRLLWENQLKIN